jgi:CheY-like chemotaxis protein
MSPSAHAQPTDRSPRRRSFHVLHVDDDDLDALNFQRAMRGSLVVAGITSARDGIEALDHLRSGALPLDRLVLVIDLRMPRMSGLELLRALRADARLRHLPVVIMTTSDDTGDLDAAYRENVAGYLLKTGDHDRYHQAITAFEDYWSTVQMP